jgi:spermidine synthase
LAQPWQTIDKVDTADGVLELRRRGERDYIILVNNRVLMNSTANRSEIALGELACARIMSRPRPSVLVGGLGMGLTLRAVLDSLTQSARVAVAELNPAIITWCKGPLAELTNNALNDARVSIKLDDVAAIIAKASQPGAHKLDAIVIDLYEGPHSGTDGINDPFYGKRALKATAAALASNGVFAVWGEAPNKAFEKRLAAAGFSVTIQRPGRGGLRHVVYVAQKKFSGGDSSVL